MNPPIEQFFKNLKRLTLTVEEKHALRQAIERRIKLDPITPPTPSPYVSIWQLWWPHYQKVAVLGVLVVGIVFGGGLSLAAEGSLPGHLLYPLKTKVNEPIVTWLTPTPVSKIWWQTEVINRRLVESQQLLTQTKTKPAAIKTLTQDLTNQIDELEKNLADLKTEDAIAVANNVHNKIEQELLGHKQLIAETVVNNKDIAPQVEQLDRVVRRQVENLAQFKQKTITTAMTATTTPTPEPTTITLPSKLKPTTPTPQP